MCSGRGGRSSFLLGALFIVIAGRPSAGPVCALAAAADTTLEGQGGQDGGYRQDSGSDVSVESRKGYDPLVGAFHVHSRFSNGQYEIFELAAYAQERHLDVLGLSDSFLTKIRYGIPPARRLLSITVSRDSVSSHGIERYFSAIGAAQGRFNNVVLLAGLEVAPSYYWRGNPMGELRLFDFDRHFLLYGLNDLTVIRNLPVIENETLANTSLDWVRLAGPLSFAIMGVLAFAIRRERMVRLSFFPHRRQRVLSVAGLGCLVLAAVGCFREYPFGSLADPYTPAHNVAPYQRLIDYARSHGGVVLWSYPEARYSDVRMRGARMISASHPEDLGLTDRYHGFEGIYGDRITATLPGNIWDHLLMEYLRGGRENWPSVITGIDFHSFKGGGWYELDRGQTILWCREKTKSAVLEALRAGRGYAAFQARPGQDLRLDTFSVVSSGREAVAGEVLETGGTLSIRAAIEWSTPAVRESPESGRLLIIRDGKVVDNLETKVPVQFEKNETLPVGRHYYRLRFDYEGYQILSNPIFVTVR